MECNMQCKMQNALPKMQFENARCKFKNAIQECNMRCQNAIRKCNFYCQNAIGKCNMRCENAVSEMQYALQENYFRNATCVAKMQFKTLTSFD